MEGDNNKCITEEDEEFTDLVNIDEKDSVQSCAVAIRQAEASPLVPYQRLELNTDLNLPPSNWLYGRDSFRFVNTVRNNSSEYSSFRIALENIDQIGDVDVVSWAQNVKTLLKIPYNPNAQVSLMLHKVGNTLLIDEFDLNLLLRNSDVHWEWFRKFFFENIYNSFTEHQKVLRPNKSRSVVINRNLLSKFLYYSLGDGNSPSTSASQTLVDEKGFKFNQSVTERGALEPPFSNTLPNNEEPSFDRHVIWNFEDIKMLIGTDLPIFEGKDNLCISLRLNEISKPINVLTGLDYWLDNLMCNVPEVAMCYHFQGLVKEYDYLKTEDLPNLPDSKFSPKEVLDVAQNILSFLKSKATKEGHTYWLFKAKDDLYVKLYDLTSLSDEPDEFCISPEGKNKQSQSSSTSKNPFGLPVAILCYKVAERLSSRNSSSLHAQICSLLINALKLLSPETYPKICCTANCLLAHAYIPNELNPQSPHLSDVSDDEECLPMTKPGTKKKKKSDSKKMKLKETTKTIENIPVEFLSRPYSKTNQIEDSFSDPAPLDKDLNVRCRQARFCILNAFKCMDKNNATENFEEQQRFNPNNPIPMPYAPLNKEGESNEKQQSISGSAKSSASEGGKLAILELGPNCTLYSWSEKMTFLLLQKIYLVCLIEAKLACNKKSYGSTLKYIKLALHSVKGIEATADKHTFNSPFDAYVLAGEVYFNLAHDFDNIESHVNEFTFMDEADLALKQRMDHICKADVLVKEMPTELEECLHLSEKCYRSVFDSEPNRISSYMRVKWGILCHSLGTVYMQKSRDMCEKYDKKMEETGLFYEQAEQYFEECRKSYSDTKNYREMTWTKMNIGHFYRLCASYHTDIHTCKKLYIKATLEYKIALRNLGKREGNEDVWDKLNLELVKTLKSHAIAFYNIYQAAKLGKELEEKIFKQIECLFEDAIAICNLDHYRNVKEFELDSLTIHSYWAKMYYLKRRNRSHVDAAIFQKTAENHYDIVLKFYKKMSLPLECLKVTLDRMDLLDGIEMLGKTVWNTSLANLKILTYNGLSLLCTYKKLQEDSKRNDTTVKSEFHVPHQALTMYHNRLTNILKSMKGASLGQYRKKNKKVIHQMIDKISMQCQKTKPDLDSLIIFVEQIKTELLAHIL